VYHFLGVELLLGEALDDGRLAHCAAAQENYLVFDVAQLGALVEHSIIYYSLPSKEGNTAV